MSVAAGTERIVVTRDEGLQFSAQIRSHRITVDQSTRGGGADAAPSPVELLGASLGTCIATYVQQFLLTRKLPCEGLRVEVEQHGATSPHRISRFDVHVVLPPDVPEKYRAMIDRVVTTCPVHNTLTHGAEVDVTIENPVPVPVTVPG